MLFKVIFILLIFSLNACGQNNHPDKIDKLVDSYVQEYGFNGNIIVYENNNLIFEKSNGYADYKTKRKLEINTPFSIGSITKTFTAVSIMILKEQGKLSYFDSLGIYFDDLPKIMNKVTINQLLNHTSGIPDYLDNYPTQNDRLTNKDIYRILKTKDYLYFQSGTEFKYCNSGYVLLALIIEKNSKTSYESFVKQNILVPLRMDKTYFLDSTNYMNDNRALGHDSTGLIYDLPLFVHGDGGLVSTTTDLYKWYSGLTNNKIISDLTFKAAILPAKLTNGDITDYGQGFEIFKTKLRFNIVGHRGGLGGTGVYFIFQTDLKNCIIAMTNNNCQKTGEMVERISMILNDFDYNKEQ
jgi:CubicO group peptidase (beta-lactamase class C family)